MEGRIWINQGNLHWNKECVRELALEEAWVRELA